MIRRFCGGYAFWRARQLAARADNTTDLSRRATLRDKALIWSNREAFLSGLISYPVYAASTRTLKAGIRRRRARNRPYVLRGITP